MSEFRKLTVLDVKRTDGNGRIIIVGVGRTDRGNGSGRGPNVLYLSPEVCFTALSINFWI